MMTSELMSAVDEVVKKVQLMLRRDITSNISTYEKEAMTVENLVCFQLNIHNDEGYLPLHHDYPKHNGFGVCIVTINITSKADIVILDMSDAPNCIVSFVFPLISNEFYTLIGESRNICNHGIVVHHDSVSRITLNLRFGLHTAHQATAIRNMWTLIGNFFVIYVALKKLINSVYIIFSQMMIFNRRVHLLSSFKFENLHLDGWMQILNQLLILGMDYFQQLRFPKIVILFILKVKKLQHNSITIVVLIKKESMEYE